MEVDHDYVLALKAEIRRLKLQLEEKDKEIERLRNEKETTKD